MLQINTLRTQPDMVKQKLAVKNFKEINLVDDIISIDEQRRAIQKQSDDLASQNNIISKQVGQLMKDGKKEEAEALKNQVSNNKDKTAALLEELRQLEAKQQTLLVTLPNLPNANVPAGKSAEDNLVVKQAGEIPTLFDGALAHWDITANHNLIDFELGVKLTGAGFPVYINKGAKLQRALINYFLDFNTAAGYIEHQVPHMVNEDSAYATGQLPDKEGQMYCATEDGFYLIPTAEVPLTNIYRDVIVQAQDFPIKLTGYTPCFRREAGSYGKDVRGLNRLHQFDKVEIVQLVAPQDSYTVHQEMVNHIEQLIISLELPYRILNLCGGDMSFASALTYDFEVYSTAQQRWLEVSSVSNFETFQTNRLKCRYKDEEGKMQLVHSLNGSSLALPRIVAGLLENHQQQDGSIYIPKALQKYIGADRL